MITQRYITLFQDEAEVKKLTMRILREGGVALPDFFDQSTFDGLVEYWHSLSTKNPKGEVYTTTHGIIPISNIAQSSDFMRVFDAIHRARCEIQGVQYTPLDPAYQDFSLSIKTPNTPEDRTPFHFDDSYVNAVLALKLPTNKRQGNLMVYPNLRSRIRPLVLSKIIARLLRHLAFLRAIVRPKEITYYERGLHLFFGDLTLHGVPALSQGERVSVTFNASRCLP